MIDSRTEAPTAPHDAAATSVTTTVPLESLRRARAQTVQKLQHAIPAAALLYAGLQGLARGERGLGLALACGEIVFSALLIRALFVSARRVFAERAGGAHVEPEHRHGAVDWSEICAGLVLLGEAAEHWHTSGHLRRPTVLLAAVTIGLGLLHGRLAERARFRRRLVVDAGGVAVRGRFRRFSARWSEIDRFEIGEREATLATRRGASRRLDFTDLRHPEAVRAALAVARDRWLAARDAAPAAAPVPR